MRAACVLAALAFPAVMAPAVAAAEPTVPCEKAADDVIDVDGMMDDWHGVKPTRVGGTDKDASFDLRCLVTGTTAWISIDVRDEHVIRGSKADDRLDLALGTGKPLAVTLYPGVDKLAPKRTLAGKALPSWLAVEDTLEPAGWSAELAVPLAKLPGWGPSAPGVALRVTLADGDIPKGTAAEHTVAWEGSLAFGGTADLLEVFLTAAKLPKTVVTLDTQAEVDPTVPGKERVVAAGDKVALLTDQFAFVNLPVQRAADVVKVELIDLRGDGEKVIAARLRQHDGGGTREVVMMWTASRGQLDPIGGFEIGKAQGDRRLTSTWKIVPGKAWRKQSGGAARVIEVRAQPAVNWDEDSYQVAPAEDVEPIAVPWDDDRVGAALWIGPDGHLESAPIKR